MASDAKQGPLSPPCVRNACEECHNRKTRCHISEDGGSCKSCQRNGRLCFFLPRYKSGRPKVPSRKSNKGSDLTPSLSTTTSIAAIATAAATAATVEPQMGNHMQHCLSNTPTTNFPHAPVPRRSLNLSEQLANGQPLTPTSINGTQPGGADYEVFPDEWQSRPISQLSPFGLPGLDADSSFPYRNLYSNNSDNQLDFRIASISNQPLHLPDDNRAETTNSRFGFPLHQPTTFGQTAITSSSSSSTPPTYSSHPQTSSAGGFSSLLTHMNQLQRHDEWIRNGAPISHHSNDPHQNQIEQTLSSIDSSCIAVCNTLKGQCQSLHESPPNRTKSFTPATTPPPGSGSGNGSVDLALIALSVTVVLKIAELCEALIERELRDAPSSLANMLLFKRLECCILQTRIALATIERLDQGLSHLTGDAKKKIGVIDGKFERLRGEVID